MRYGLLSRLLFIAALVCNHAHAVSPEAIEIPFSDSVRLKAWLFQPEVDEKNKGPFPTVIINHGSPPGGAPERAKMDPKYTAAAEQFVKWGFVVVVPTRRGYGGTGGRWAEDSGNCDNPNFYKGGLESAKDINAALRYAAALPQVDAKRIVLLGQSAGGWGVLATATQPAVEVKAVINFAGGRGGHKNQQANNNCSPDSLVRAAGDYGAETKLPTLWIYTENDSFFAPELAKRMFESYQSHGGKGRMLALPAFARDGHTLFGSGLTVWKPIVESYLKENELLK